MVFFLIGDHKALISFFMFIEEIVFLFPYLEFIIQNRLHEALPLNGHVYVPRRLTIHGFVTCLATLQISG